MDVMKLSEDIYFLNKSMLQLYIVMLFKWFEHSDTGKFQYFESL